MTKEIGGKKNLSDCPFPAVKHRVIVVTRVAETNLKDSEAQQ